MLHSEVAVKGLGIGNKRLQHNIVDLFLGSSTDPDRRSLHGEWTYINTHTDNKYANEAIKGKNLVLVHFSFGWKLERTVKITLGL